MKIYDDETGLMIVVGIFGIMFTLLILSTPIAVNVAGSTMTAPLIGWIAFTSIAILALVVYLKK